MALVSRTHGVRPASKDTVSSSRSSSAGYPKRRPAGSGGTDAATDPLGRTLIGRAVVSGSAEGSALVTVEPLSLWGGLNAHTGEIIDRRHERSGEIVSGRVFVLPQGRGSSTASAVLLESVKAGRAPAAIINARLDPILALGSILAGELYHQPVPIVVLAQADFNSIREGDYVIIRPDGTVRIEQRESLPRN